MRNVVMGAAAAAVLTGLSGAALAAVKGTFIGPGTYATKDGCEKAARVKAGGELGPGNVPETLTEDGFATWEGQCAFISFTEVTAGKVWKAKLHCGEGESEGDESDIFERLDNGTIKITVMGEDTIFQRCDADKGK